MRLENEAGRLSMKVASQVTMIEVIVSQMQIHFGIRSDSGKPFLNIDIKKDTTTAKATRSIIPC